MIRVLIAGLIGAGLMSIGVAEELRFKIPDWDNVEWGNLPDGQAELEPRDFRGRVLVLFCFQAICGGCKKGHAPVLAEVYKKYEKDPRVAFVAIQTSFEGGEKNTMDSGRKMIVDTFGMNIPVGLNGTGHHDSDLMNRYQTGGTPCTFVVDTTGKARFKKFGDVNWEKEESMNAFREGLVEVIEKYIGRAKADAPEVEDKKGVGVVSSRLLKNREGREIDAELLGLDGDVLRIRARGRVFQISVSELSDEDQEFFKTWKGPGL